MRSLDETRAALRKEIGPPSDRDERWRPMISAGEVRALLDALDERDKGPVSGGESVLPGETVIELIQLVGDVVMFADHRSKPDVAFSMPRTSWDDLGNPTVITVAAWPGGDFTPKPDPVVPAVTSRGNIEQALERMSTGPYL